MKTEEIKSIENTFVGQLRDIRDKISFELKDLTLEQKKEYFKNKKTLHPTWYL